MSPADKLNLLIDYSSQIDLKNHKSIKYEEGEFKLAKGNTDLAPLVELVNQLSQQSLDDSQKRELASSLEIIQDHLKNQPKRGFKKILSSLVTKGGKNPHNTAVQRIDEISQKLGVKIEKKPPQSEGEARLKYYHEAAPSIGIKMAADIKDYDVIKEISQRLWKASEGDYAQYESLMTAFFKGEHFLILEDDEKKDSLFGALQKEGSIRKSSHYEKGSLDGSITGPAPKTADEIKHPQLSVTGPQIKHLLFGHVTVARNKKTKEIIYGKTFDQAIDQLSKSKKNSKLNEKELQNRKDKFKQDYEEVPATWFQTEGAPDSGRPLNKNFWKHRVRDFMVYVVRKKIFSSDMPNVGPYGYGHGDDRPTTLPPASKP